METDSSPPVLVSLVTFNDERFLPACLDSLQKQTFPVRVKVFDNASHDDSCAIVSGCGVEVHCADRNLGYSFGHNRNLENEEFEAVLLLNADIILEPDFVKILVCTLREVDRAGMAGGKLLRMTPDGKPVFVDGVPVLDSTGVFFTPSQRHFDRGSEEVDQGQYERRQLVFGITGAAVLCSKKMLEDVRMGDEYLDEDFFAYREDADLAWRAQLRGWRSVYEPRARALHRRNVLPSRRRHLSALVKYHAFKNRYLMRMKNLDPAVRWRCFPYMWLRDLGILVYVLVFEWSSLPAYAEVWSLRRKFRKKAAYVRSRRAVAEDAIARWFSFTPAAIDL